MRPPGDCPSSSSAPTRPRPLARDRNKADKDGARRHDRLIHRFRLGRLAMRIVLADWHSTGQKVELRPPRPYLLRRSCRRAGRLGNIVCVRGGIDARCWKCEPSRTRANSPSMSAPRPSRIASSTGSRKACGKAASPPSSTSLFIAKEARTAGAEGTGFDTIGPAPGELRHTRLPQLRSWSFWGKRAFHPGFRHRRRWLYHRRHESFREALSRRNNRHDPIGEGSV